MSKHEIVDVSGMPVRGACTFNYRGFTVSVSTVFDSRGGSVALFDALGVGTYFDDVESAINHINSL